MPFRGRIAYPSYVDESLFGNPHETTVRMARSMPQGLKESVLIKDVGRVQSGVSGSSLCY